MEGYFCSLLRLGFGIGFRDVRRADLFVWEFLQAKRPVRSNGEEWACLGIHGSVSRSPTEI